MEIKPGQTWIERNSGEMHSIDRTTTYFVFHRRYGHDKVERTRTSNFRSHCRILCDERAAAEITRA